MSAQSSGANNQRGLVLAAHGARDERTMEATRALARLVSVELPDVPLEMGVLEFARPTIGEAIDRLAGRGVSRATVVPLFLAAGAHVQRDIPDIIREKVAHHPRIALNPTPHIGSHPSVLAIAAARFRAALAGSQGRVPRAEDDGRSLVPRHDDTLAESKVADEQPAAPGPSDCGLIVLAHGSRRGEALEETHRFTERLRAELGVDHATCGFLSMGQPRSDIVLREAAGWPVDRVVVFGHFLFRGRMIDTVKQLVSATMAGNRSKQWLAAGPLGTGRELAQAAAELWRSATRDA